MQPKPEANNEWKVGDVILDLYEVKQVHKGGGMGLVYRVHHRGWNMDLAVKSPRLEYFQTEVQKANFARECETWINLGLHPHVVSCYYVRNLGNIPRIFAEYVEGGSLRQSIDSRKVYEGGQHEALKRILDVAIQMAWALDFAHEQGLIHQDVKPANVLVTPDGTAKVTDFGLAKARAATGEGRQADKDQSILVSSGGMTPAYCSPEQANNQPLSRRSDIWSWAVSVLEMFVGGVCWQSGVAAQAVLEQLNEVRVDGIELPDMPNQVQALLRKCFEFDPDARPKSFKEISAWLLAAHQLEVKEDYPRLEPSTMELRADGLNNRAVSLFDLGREQAALAVFDEALRIHPNHTEAIYNRGLAMWRKGQITDKALLAAIKGASADNGENWRGELALGLVDLERGDKESALRELERANAVGFQNAEVRQALHRASNSTVSAGCLRMFEGHEDGVKSVAISPDSQWVVSGSLDKTLRLWELETARCVRTFEGQTNLVERVAISPDGRWALTEGLRVWELATGRCDRKFKGCADSLAISLDGRWCLAATHSFGIRLDHTLQLWEFASGRSVRVFEGHTKRVFSVAISPNGRWGLSGSRDETLRLWELETGRCVWAVKAHKEGVRTVAISPCGRWCLSGGDDETLGLWELESGRCVRAIKGHTNGVTSVAISPDGRWGLSGSHDNTVRLWELGSGRCLRTFDGHTKGVTSVAISPDGRLGVSGSFDSTVRLWELPVMGTRSPYRLCLPLLTLDQSAEAARFSAFMKTASTAMSRERWEEAALAVRNARSCVGFFSAKEAMNACASVGRFGIKTGLAGGWCLRTFEGSSESVSSIAISPTGDWCLSSGGFSDKTLRLWERETGKCVRTFEGHRDGVASVAISPDGRWGLSGSCDHTLRLWNLETGRCLRTFEGHTDRVCSVSISPDGRWGLSGSFDCTLRLWKLKTARCVRTFEGHTFWVEAVAISPDGRWGLSGSYDKTVRLWELETGRCVRTFEGHTGHVNTVEFSPNGRWGVSGSDDETLRLWELATGNCIQTFEGHRDGATSVAITPDSRWALSGSRDHTLRLWELETGRCARTFEGHTNRVWCVRISPDGRWVLSGSHDNSARLWELDWEYEFPKAADWNEGVNPYLEIFLTLHCPIGDDGITRVGKPSWTEHDFHLLITDLQDRGYGWLRPGGVRRQLEKMTAEWKGPPPLPWEQAT